MGRHVYRWYFGVVLGLGFGVMAVHAGPVATGGAPITVGTGVNSAALQIEFASGALFTFDLLFGDAPADTLTGLTLLDLVEAETTLVTERQVFDFGVLIDGIGFMGEHDAGYGGGENYWHYWTWDPGQTDWSAAQVGVGDRVVADGARDGWVYGSALPPGAVPEPATFALMALGGAHILRRRHDR